MSDEKGKNVRHMVEISERVTVRIPQELLEKLKLIQKAEGHTTISDTIRIGLMKYLELKMAPANIRKIVVDISRQDNTQLEALVQDGSSVSVDDAIRSAVREYVRAKMYGTKDTSEEPDSTLT